MMFQIASELVVGGWDAIDNIAQGIGKGASTFVSGFFPTPQREKVISETIQAAGGSGKTSRATTPEGQSWIETMEFATRGWLDSPYEAQFAIPVKIQESKQLAQTVATPKSSDWIGEGLDWALKQSSKITTLVDEIGGALRQREVIVGTPRAGYPEGQDEAHLNDLTSRIAEVVNLGKSMGSDFVKQVKGLFNLGFGQTEAQPGFQIQHELQPSRQTWIGLAVIAAIIIAVIFLGRKK